MKVSEIVADTNLDFLFGASGEVSPRTFIDYHVATYGITTDAARDVLYRMAEAGRIQLTPEFRVKRLEKSGSDLFSANGIAGYQRAEALKVMSRASSFSQGLVIYPKIVGELEALIRIGWRPPATEPETIAWERGRWWRVLGPDDSLWCATSNENEARESMRPGDTLWNMQVAPQVNRWVMVRTDEKKAKKKKKKKKKTDEFPAGLIPQAALDLPSSVQS